MTYINRIKIDIGDPAAFESSLAAALKANGITPESLRPEHGPHMIGRRFINEGTTFQITGWESHGDGLWHYDDAYVMSSGRIAIGGHCIPADFDAEPPACKWLPEHGEHNVGRVVMELPDGVPIVATHYEASGDYGPRYKNPARCRHFVVDDVRAVSCFGKTWRWATPEETAEYFAREAPRQDGGVLAIPPEILQRDALENLNRAVAEAHQTCHGCRGGVHGAYLACGDWESRPGSLGDLRATQEHVVAMPLPPEPWPDPDDLVCEPARSAMWGDR